MTQTQSNPIVKLSTSPEKAAQEVIAIITDITNLYKEENQILADAKTRDFQALHETKMWHVSRYEQAIHQMVARKEDMKSLSVTTKNKLQALQASFAEIASTNTDRLQRLHQATSRLGNTIRTAATEAVAKRTSTGYGASGKVENSRTRNMSVGINETI